jgi:pimeloyl-ACP methyl ester carboxylesterase
MRGYNLSSKPAGVAAYDVDPLARDVRDLIVERGGERAFLAGHDWGAVVAWFTAMNHGEIIERLAILNVHHPRRFLDEGLRSPRQLAKSWYVFFFQLPGSLSVSCEAVIGAVFRQTPRKQAARIRTVEAPTLVIWGERDRYSVRELAEPDRSDVPNLDRVVRFPEATHWVQHDEPAKVSGLLAEFFGSMSRTAPSRG